MCDLNYFSVLYLWLINAVVCVSGELCQTVIQLFHLYSDDNSYLINYFVCMAIA